MKVLYLLSFSTLNPSEVLARTPRTRRSTTSQVLNPFESVQRRAQVKEEVSVVNLSKKRLKTAAAGSVQSQKDSTLEKLLNAKREEYARIHLKESEWKISKVLAPS